MTKNLEEYVNQSKKPSLNMLFLETKVDNPNVDSHLGGLPYFTENDTWPTCDKCKKDMIFLMQLRQLNQDNSVVLTVLYHCRCQVEHYDPQIKVYEYENPDIKRSITVNKSEKVLPYVAIRFEASWSLPHWNLLPLYNQEGYKAILSYHKGDKQLSEDWYESIRWNENFLATEPYSLIKGYPEFSASPKIVKCNCCNKTTDFVFQLDSYDDYKITWKDGEILYCFRCPRTNTYYFIIN
ncbi:DUF1963 domain-containing protein [Bacillus mexicanus]|uniref:DUF1963 domain-containing protein n=1 Tax=Bacillus mexicanus TaxID=2834415 RepID=UPI003D25FC6F